jgi:hypothetical protein
MTWVIGMAEHFIGGVLVGDVRVSFKKGPDQDIIQKIHQVAPNVAAGFSGSVWLGFRMVEDLRAFARSYTSSNCVPTDRFVQDWAARARTEWHGAPTKEQELGCSLLIVGAEETRGVRTRNSGYLLRAPDFTPVQFGKTPASIGSGSRIDEYRNLLEVDGLQWLKMLMPLSVSQGGPLDPLGAILGKRIERNPKPGVSPHLHLCVIRCHDLIWRNNDQTHRRGGAWTMPQVASDYQTFRRLCNNKGIAAEVARA